MDPTVEVRASTCFRPSGYLKKHSPAYFVLFICFSGFIQSEIFQALKKTRLLVVGKEESQYSRCGRTDKGVSSVGQVNQLSKHH